MQSISTHTLSLRLWAGLMPWAPGKLYFILKSLYDLERNFLIHQCSYFEMNKNQSTKNKSFSINQHKIMLFQNYTQDTQCISKCVLDPDIKVLHYSLYVQVSNEKLYNETEKARSDRLQTHKHTQNVCWLIPPNLFQLHWFFNTINTACKTKI